MFDFGEQSSYPDKRRISGYGVLPTAPTCCWGWFPWTHRGRSLAGSWWWKRQSWTPFRSTRRAAVECCASLLCYNKVKSPYSSQFQGKCQRNADHMQRMLDKQADMYINMPTTLWGEEIICRGAPHLKITTCSRVSNNKLKHRSDWRKICVKVQGQTATTPPRNNTMQAKR